MKISASINFKKSKSNMARFQLSLHWTILPRVYGRKFIYLPRQYQCHESHYSRKKKIITGTSLEATTVRDRHFKLLDYCRSLDYETAEMNIEAVMEYLGLKKTSDSIKLDTLADFIKQHIEINSSALSKYTIFGYGTLLMCVNDFVAKHNMPPSLAALNKDQQTVWFSKFIQYLLAPSPPQKPAAYQNATVKLMLQKLQAIATRFDSVGLKIKPVAMVRKLRSGSGNKDKYCTVSEFKAILAADRSGMSQNEDIALDLFIFQCLTGLRYGELNQVKDAAISTRMAEGKTFVSLNYVSHKTGTPNAVPLPNRAMDIINKWRHKSNRKDCLLPTLSSGVINNYLHDALKKIPGFEVTNVVIKYNGERRIEENVPRYDLITTHAARRTYSHLLMRAGLNTRDVSGLLNHSNQDTTEKHYQHLQRDEIQLSALGVLEQFG